MAQKMATAGLAACLFNCLLTPPAQAGLLYCQTASESCSILELRLAEFKEETLMVMTYFAQPPLDRNQVLLFRRTLDESIPDAGEGQQFAFRNPHG